MFGDFGGRRRSGNVLVKGNDLRYNEISLEEAFEGKETRIRVPTAVTCDGCQGSGAAPGSRPVTFLPRKGHGKCDRVRGFLQWKKPVLHAKGLVKQ